MKPIKRAIIACWVMLVACFAIKIFGGNWFEIVCTNEHFLKFCEFIEGNQFVYVPLSYFVYVVPTIVIILPICNLKKPNKNQIIETIFIISCLWGLCYVDNNIKLFAEFIAICTLPIIVNKTSEVTVKSVIKKYWWRGIAGYFVILLFQVISLLTRNIGIKVVDENLVITYILLIDYFIMSILFYLYFISKKGKKYNG